MASFDVRPLRSECGDRMLDDGIYVDCAPSSQCVNLTLPILYPIDSPRMVNYHDPIVIARDDCAFTFAAKHAS